MDNTLAQNPTSPAKVVTLLDQLVRVEDLTSSLVIRLDPIIDRSNDSNSSPTPSPSSQTVTGRLSQLGDVLQYLLNRIEL